MAVGAAEMAGMDVIADAVALMTVTVAMTATGQGATVETVMAATNSSGGMIFNVDGMSARRGAATVLVRKYQMQVKNADSFLELVKK